LSLSLVEIPTSRYEIASHGKEERPAPAPAAPPPPAVQLAVAGEAVRAAVASTRLPEGVTLLDVVVTLPGHGPVVELCYLAEREVSDDARDLIARDVRSRIGSADVGVAFRFTPETADVRFAANAPDASGAAAVDAIADAMSRNADLAVEIASRSTRSDSAHASSLRERLVKAGVAGDRVTVRSDPAVAARMVRLHLLQKRRAS
jgi:hypothetical protein